uniref:Uncharacterized protein n=1 Tax=Lotharella oceanica TaxID=641309 RepID=A0A7S2TE66_9EUKA|mmetsp:Transcript_10043/g.19272  ORF Transcript_10043/g.19272 Transcript_10043/m.19272 type:complete len:111 (+) Transcript_10043:348-680(+)|eukprot:CAMPEP_0170174788 /NCGR_PEP_ID=MMETSP0040_2-20121228/7991_1 /TAXON_ID=641309 /ORGANISM="Lotharella oceanica, Strain CCMP622" /LENGTH=110 /DNA_ID=CAMNT_0010416573 /DNA_START=344 /DNA_END=676 /DNA_ORIENTATION=+
MVSFGGLVNGSPTVATTTTNAVTVTARASAAATATAVAESQQNVSGSVPERKHLQADQRVTLETRQEHETDEVPNPSRDDLTMTAPPGGRDPGGEIDSAGGPEAFLFRLL